MYPIGKPTRRQALTLISGSALVATTGAYQFSQNAKAVEVGIQEFSIPDQSKSAPDAPDSIMLQLTGEYQVDANVVPDTLVLTPRAKTEGGLGFFDFPPVEIPLDGKTSSGQVDLERDLLNLSSLRDGFPTNEGESLTKEIVVELVGTVKKNTEVIGEESSQVTFPLTLGHEVNQASIGWTVNGNVTLN